jgi:hypothetical protein
MGNRQQSFGSPNGSTGVPVPNSGPPRPVHAPPGSSPISPEAASPHGAAMTPSTPNEHIKQAAGTPNSGGLFKKGKRIPREKNRYGSVIVKVTSLSSNRRLQERQTMFTITPRGGLFFGTQCNPIAVQKGS